MNRRTSLGFFMISVCLFMGVAAAGRQESTAKKKAVPVPQTEQSIVLPSPPAPAGSAASANVLPSLPITPIQPHLPTLGGLPAGPFAGYGDGSGGPLVITGTVDWTQNPPSSANFQFTSMQVQPDAVWTIPSGLTIRSAGDFQVYGTVIVTTGPTELLYGDTIPVGISASAPDQQGAGAKGITPLQASQILRPGIVGGSEGEPCGNPVGGAGGGTLVLRVGGNLNVSGSIQAKGADGPVCSATSPVGIFGEGSGGGGGGFILVAVQFNVNVTGNIDVSGGNGGNGAGASAEFTGQNGSGGGGGVLHVITPNTPTNLGFTSNGGTAGSGALTLNSGNGGGSCGGDGGGTPGGGNATNGQNGFLIVTQAPQPGLLFQ